MAAAGHPAGDASALQLRHVAGSMGASSPLARARWELFGGAERIPKESERHTQERVLRGEGIRLYTGEQAQDEGRDETGGSKNWARRPSAELPQGSAVTLWRACRPLATV
jgi:hypothetical protein